MESIVRSHRVIAKVGLPFSISCLLLIGCKDTDSPLNSQERSPSDGLARPLSGSVDTPPQSSPGSNAPGPESNAQGKERLVRIEISGFDGEAGDCRIAIYAIAKGFNDPEQAIAREIVPVRSNRIQWEFPLAKHLELQDTGTLAISAYHDKNENGRLDKNSIGIPTERYGFSNNPKRGFGPPSFQQAAVKIPAVGDSEVEPWVLQIEVR